MVATTTLSDLSTEDRLALEAWLVEFDVCWTKDCLLGKLRTLPPAAWRQQATIEMVTIDMERRWRLAPPAWLEQYLREIPELGSPDTVSAELIATEYAIRRECGEQVSFEDYSRRFPSRAEQLKQLLSIAPPSWLGEASEATNHKSVALAPTMALSRTQPTAITLPREFGRYRILGRLGSGGMGTVYLARDTQLERQVALKVPHFLPSDGPETIERSYREARAAAALQHANICPVHDVAAINGVPYLTMAYLDGRPLSECIAMGQPMDQRRAAELVACLAGALQMAHQRGIIHRDLKPSNIMLTSSGNPVIMDFGLARRTDSIDDQLTLSGMLVGTPAYMPPEQIRGDQHSVGPGCDIYALGVILYELLTGKRPFGGPLTAVLARVLVEEAPLLSESRPDIDPRLEAICQRAMSKSFADRYSTMDQLGSDLIAYLRNQPISRSLRRVRGSTGRRRKSLRAAALSLALVLGLSAYAATQFPTLAALFVPIELSTRYANPTGDVHVENRAPPPPAIAPFDGDHARAHQQAWAAYLGVPTETDELGMKMVLIPPGEFFMGATEEEIQFVFANSTPKPGYEESIAAERRSELPQHKVTLTKPFWLAATELTVGQFRKFVEATRYQTDAERAGGGLIAEGGKTIAKPDVSWNNPGHEQTGDCPVVQVSWNDAIEYCNWLSREHGLTPAYVRDESNNSARVISGNGYRLPTEAEWEFACRAGTTTRYFSGDDVRELGYYAWFAGSPPRTQPVGRKLPNPFGLLDIQGNVREWVQDWHDGTYFANSPPVDPQGPATGTLRVLRGGDWAFHALACRSACRTYQATSYRFMSIGFRVARSIHTTP